MDLIEAAVYGKLEKVKELLSVEGTDVNLQSAIGHTALMQASRYDHPDIVKELLSVKDSAAGVNILDLFNCTALIFASCHLEVTKELLSLEEGVAGINLQNWVGDTALTCASRYGYSEVVKELVMKGAMISAKSIWKARDNRHTDLADMLEEWSDDQKMLFKLSLQQRCWLTVLINKIEYTGAFGVPLIIIHILNKIWLEGSSGTVDSSVGTCTIDSGAIWAQGYVARMRKEL